MSMGIWKSTDGTDCSILYMKMGEWVYRLKIAAEVEDYEEVSCVAKEMEKFCKEGQ